MDREAACESVARKGWLRHTPASFRRAVLDRCRLENFTEGTTVYAIGDDPGGMYGIAAGALAVSVSPGDLGPYTAHFGLPGGWYGQASVFTRQPRRVGLIATRDSQLLHLPLRAIDELVRHDPGAWQFFGLLTILQLDAAVEATDDLMIRAHCKRLVAALLRLGDCHRTKPQNRMPIELDISHEDLAHLANVARTTAGSVLRELEADGHVKLAYRRITILAPDALKLKLQD